jgi:hypothetical protein
MPAPNYALLREIAGCLFLLDLLSYLPFASVCLGPGYWKGRWLESVPARAAVVAGWALGSLSLVLGVYPLIGALVLFLIFRAVYVRGRWLTLFRGGGAPGFMSHYLAAVLFFLEASAWLDGSGGLSAHTLRVIRIDFGVILLCSGTYKSLSGYLRGEGMEYGLANPFWGYWHRWFGRMRPRHPLLLLQDRGAAITQVLMGLFLIVPPTRPIGALLCSAGFFYLLFTVRLGRLAALMMALPLLYLPDLGISLFGGLGAARGFAPIATPALVLAALAGVGWAYLALLPAVKAMQYLNLFANLRYPEPLQSWLTRYANFVPIIMWRVFTPDVTNFFIRIAEIDRASGRETPIADEDTAYSYRHWKNLSEKLRFLHVTESIAITTVFTTLKYFKSKRGLFEAKLVEYARSLGRGDRALIHFQYVAILKGEREFKYVNVCDFVVDPRDGTVEERKLIPEFSYSAPAQYSHITETTGYGSYAPL